MLIGRVAQGKISIGDRLHTVNQAGETVESSKVQKIIKKFAMNEVNLQTAYSGDIVSIGGFMNSTVTDTINLLGQFKPIPAIPIDPPMIQLNVSFNDSPLNGKDGDKLTVLQIRNRLIKEGQDDVSLRVAEKTRNDEVQIAGRGDLHLGILLERMRREGFELSVTPPQVIMKKEGKLLLEPIESVIIEVDQCYVLSIIDQMNNRKGMLLNTIDLPNNQTRL